MNFIFAKLYERYKKKNESAAFNITLYISIVYFFLLFAILLPIGEFLETLFFKGNMKHDKEVFIIFSFIVLSFITYLVFYKYIKKKKINKLVIKYQGQKINKFMLYLLVMLMPAFFLVLGGTITVVLKGGKILNWQIDGIIN